MLFLYLPPRPSQKPDRYNLFKRNCEHLVTFAMTGYGISVQIADVYRKLLIYSKHSFTWLFASVASSALVVGSCVISRLGVFGIITAGMCSVADSYAAEGFQLGVRAVLNSTAVSLGTAVGVALVIAIIFEGIMAFCAYHTLKRKKKFDLISDADFKRGILKIVGQTTGTIVGAVAGAVIGNVVGSLVTQFAIPIPIVGAAIGCFAGTAIGIALGCAMGKIIANTVKDEEVTDLPSAVTITVIDDKNTN